MNIYKYNMQKTELEPIINNKYINNKDLLIVSLLEYICNISNVSHHDFVDICEYLHKNGILLDENIYSQNTELRALCIKFIWTIINKNRIGDQYSGSIEYDKLSTSNLSRYKSDFIPNLSRYKSDFMEIAKINSGGFGSVYKVYNKIDQCMYAIKKIPIYDMDDFIPFEEVKKLSNLNHENIVRYHTTWIEFDKVDESLYLEHNSGSNSGSNSESNNKMVSYNKIMPILYIKMELCDESLRDYITKNDYNPTQILYQILISLQYIHSKDIIHRDLNPNNILIKNNIIKIGDFGISKNAFNNEIIIDDDNGISLYKSPEQIENKICTKKSDIYSVGIIYFELLMKFTTFTEKIKEINKIKNDINIYNLPEKEKNLLNTMLTKNHETRYSAEAVLAHFEKFYV
jgi:serine/threonine protein kinase